MDGKVSYSQTRSLSFLSDSGTFRAWPNPAMRSLFVEMGGNEDFTGEIKLVDIAGNLILRKDVGGGDHDIYFDIQDIEPGLYHLIIESPYTLQTEKIVIVK